MSLFGKKPTTEEVVKKWKRELRKEDRELDKTIRSIEVEEQKLKRSIKELAKKGDKASAKVLAKEIVQSRKAKERIYKSKAQLNSVSMQLSTSLSMMKVAGVMQKSTQIMGIMNNLVKLPQINQVMMSMAREMEKAGLIEEVMEDVMDNDAELDEQADEELDKVVEEITLGIKTAATAHQALPQQKGEEEDDDMKDLEKRLGALKE